MNLDSDLVAEHEALLEFLYICPVGLAQLSPDGDVEMINPALARMLMQLGVRSVENLFTALAPHGTALASLCAGLTANKGSICEAHRLAFEREGMPLVTFAVTMLKLSETRLIAVIADESRLVDQERVARRAEQRMSAVMDGVRDYAIFTLDRDGSVETWNKSAERLFGYSADEMVGQDYAVLFPRDDTSDPRHRSVMAEASAGGFGDDEGWWSRKETTRFWGSTVVSIVEGPNGERAGYVVVTRDLTKKKREEDDLRNAATHDFLTGLLNRRAFEEAAREEVLRWRRGRDPLSLLVIDADHFKRINDTYGHGAGDEVLRTLAAAIEDQIRDLDVAARIGGEEFVVLLPSTDLVGARACAERVRQAVEEIRITLTDGRLVRATVSIGISQLSRARNTIELLLQGADAALYEAKRRGRNCSVVGHDADESERRNVRKSIAPPTAVGGPTTER